MKAINVLSKAAYAAPLVPSILIGWAVYESANEITVPLFRIAAAVAFAVAFEGAGVLAGALKDRRFLWGYIGLGIATLISLEFFNTSQLTVGVAALLVAALVYTVMGERERETVDNVDSRHDRQLAATRRHELKLAKIAAEAERKVSVNLPEGSGKAITWRKLTSEDKRYLLDLSASEAAKEYQVTERTARNWKARLNGVKS